MSDPRLKAFAMVMRRLDRLQLSLRDTLTAQQKERDGAISRVEQQNREIGRATEDLLAREARIDTLLNGGKSVRIEELLSLEDHRGEAVVRRAALVAELGQLRDALAQADQKIEQTRAAIMRNDARRDLCNARIAKLHALAQTALDDMQDEEAEEGVVNRQIAQRTRSQRDSGRTPR
jgi:chromosome segregation ATPase